MAIIAARPHALARRSASVVQSAHRASARGARQPRLAVRCDVTKSEDMQRAQGDNAGTENRGMGSHHRCQSPRRIPVHEIRDPADARAGRRRDREHVFGRRDQRVQRRSRVRRGKTRRHRLDRGDCIHRRIRPEKPRRLRTKSRRHRRRDQAARRHRAVRARLAVISCKLCPRTFKLFEPSCRFSTGDDFDVFI